jgi:(p)ppGpp synthase/HD superfamily hydrolase
MDSLEQTHRPLLEAISFAARVHQGQLRKDQRTPYAAHPFRVCLVLRHVFGIDDEAALTAAVLHDTIEDTTTDFDDIRERFGEAVASWVAALSKDKRREEGEREEEYRAALAAAPWQVKACKLGDVFDNLLDSQHFPPEKRRRTMEHARLYLAALDTPDLPPPVRRAHETVIRLLEEMESLRV